MIDAIKEQLQNKGIKLQIVPIECLSDIKADIKHFREAESLNRFQKWIVDERYILDVPKFDFVPKSIVVAAVNLNLVHATFHHEGKQISDILDISKNGIKEYMNKIFETYGYFLEYVHWLPQKRIATRCGLAEYGRNNLTYVDGWGSFIQLFTFFSDIPYKDYIWRDVKKMDICNYCTLCLNNCPTRAILPDRFLINNEICLTKQNEWGTHPFPDWIPKSAHHRLTGCLRCQNICPKNRTILLNVNDSVEFSEEETALLLTGVERENMPHSIIEKIESYNINLFFESLPRNLKAMFDAVSK